MTVYAKMLNLDFGLSFQVQMAQAAGAGKAGEISFRSRKSGNRSRDFSFLQKVKTPFARTDGNKLDQVFHKLLLDPDPDDGLLVCWLGI